MRPRVQDRAGFRRLSHAIGGIADLGSFESQSLVQVENRDVVSELRVPRDDGRMIRGTKTHA